MNTVEQKIFRDGVLVNLNARFWAGLARNTREDVGLAATAELPGFVAGLGMKRLIPKHYAKEWSNLISRARYAIERYSFKFPAGEGRFVPLANLLPLQETLTDMQGQYRASVAGFLERYEVEQERILAQYPDHRASLLAAFPDRKTVEGRFAFDWEVYAVTLPPAGSGRLVGVTVDGAQVPVDPEQAARDIAMAKYRDKLEASFAGFLDEAVSALRGEAVKICRGVEERLAKGEIITEKSLSALKRFFVRFKGMNFVGDHQMAAELSKVEKSIADRSAKDLSAEGMRQEFAASLRRISLAVNEISDVNAVTGGYRRRIAVD